MYNFCINNLFWAKNKIAILVALAVIFLVGLFWTRSQTEFRRNGENDPGLVYGNASLEDLVNKDTDGDGIPDWEETLLGTDPTKADTDGDGIPDNIVIDKIKSGNNVDGITQPAYIEPENLTETDLFTQEVFGAVSVLSQEGTLDEVAINALSTSLADSILNAPQRKIFTISNIKTTQDDSKEATLKYGQQLATLQANHPLGGWEEVAFILLESITPEGETDVSALNKLDPIIAQLDAVVKGLAITDTPAYIAPMHLLIINGFQKLSENLTDIKLMEADPILAFSALNKYEDNYTEMIVYVNQLFSLLRLKLSS